MKVLVPVVLALLGAAGTAPAAPREKPNIIFVLADDLGMDGVSCYGSDKHKTPHIDSLAASGTRFSTCYASPLCGPSRCLLMTGRYAFRTGGITNQSWRAGGQGAKSADEFPMARLLKQAGYATGQAGKWRQIGELPGDWGFDEFLTDNTAGGWYWQTRYNKNGREINLPEGAYGPNVIQDFTFDFIRRHKDKPFFFYYAMHLVHTPILRTPDTQPGMNDSDRLYDDNIRYMDKQLGALVAELERQGLRQKTLIIFTGDNGTAAGRPCPIHGRAINGWKGSMLEGGSRVPFIASWPGATPAGKVLDDIISFADPYATFAEIAGVKPPEGFQVDGQSFEPQLRGQPGNPRKWAYVQLDGHWYVREPGFKLNEAGNLFDMSDAPFTEKPIEPADDTPQSKAARQRLSAGLAKLDPAGGKVDRDGGNRRQNNRAAVPTSGPRKVGPLKSGDSLLTAEAPFVAGKALEITAEIEPAGGDGVIVSQGGGNRGYALYLAHGKLTFAVRQQGKLTQIAAKEVLGQGRFTVEATLGPRGKLALLVNREQVAEGKAAGPIGQQPAAGLFVGMSGKAAVGDYTPPAVFKGKVSNVMVKTQ